MARFDKYDPTSGGFRAKLGFAPAANQVGVPLGVVIDGNGRVQLTGADGSTAKGVICMDRQLAQLDTVDVMTDGEIVDVTTAQVASAAAGATVKIIGAGAVTAGAGTGIVAGWFIEAWRLVVRTGRL
jgi:hypothetical protein